LDRLDIPVNMRPTPAKHPWLTVGGEVAALLADLDSAAFDAAVAALRPNGRRWFSTGQGRSGLVAQMAAMRLMHLGRDVHVLGEATAPSIGSADGLLVISGSGHTPVSLHFARQTKELGGQVLAVTANLTSPLGASADIVLQVPRTKSSQFGGSLFEQGALLVLDAVVLALAAEQQDAYRTMQARHTNLR
jgi:6-phospho-3-hexuloisomerase